MVSTLLAAFTCLAVVWNLPPVYTAHTTLIIGKTMTNPNPSNNDFWLNQQLANLYMDLANREPVQAAVAKALGLTSLPRYAVKPIGNNQFIDIDVTDADPQLAMKVAAELAHQLVLLSPGGTPVTSSSRDQFTADQIEKTQQQIMDTENQIAKKQAELDGIQSARDLETAKQDLKTLQDKLTILRTNYSNLLANTKSSAANTIEVFEPAILPTKPTGMSKVLLMAVAAVGGLALGIGAAYLIEGLDRTIKTPRDVQNSLGLPVIGYLMDLGKAYHHNLYVADHPRSMMAEAFRSLRANLETQFDSAGVKVILVTSPDEGEGKTSVSVNLALNLAQGGRNVILVDADLRRPTVHEYFKVEGQAGTKEVLEGKVMPEAALYKYSERCSVLFAGGEEEILDKYLSPDRVAAFLAQLDELAEVVIIDTPPIPVSDTLVFASKVDAILMVIRPGTANRDVVRLMKERLEAVQAKIIGVVLNRIPLGRLGSFGNYRYYAPYYYSSRGKQPVKG